MSNTNSSNKSSKKARTSSSTTETMAEGGEESDFLKVREYLLRCPVVGTGGGGDVSKNPAILAAISGLDTELQRRKRDAKLHDKFMSSAVAVEKPPMEAPAEPLESKVKSGNNFLGAAGDIAMNESDEWEDVAAMDKDINTNENNNESALAKQVIELMAQHPDGVRVSDPLGAVAVALHSALLSLNFKCTGLPENNNNDKSGGFAPPVRELPPSMFMPDKWETKSDGCIALRYRKNESGSVVLKLHPKDGNVNECESTIEVNFQPSAAAAKSGTSESSLVIKLGDYVNLESFGHAAKSSALVPPALHYKSLSNLLARFASTFDLGGCGSTAGIAVEAATNPTPEQLPYVDTTVLNTARAVQQQQPVNALVPPQPQPMGIDNNTGNFRPTNPPRDETKPPLIDEEFPTRPLNGMPHGDFSDDLLPSGLPSIGGGIGGRPAHMGGNMMGPNHPMFHGGSGVGGGVGSGSGFGMRPKFDPFGPPGGPTETDPQNPNKPRIPGGTGNPNRDDMRMPNDFNNNNNMFM